MYKYFLMSLKCKYTLLNRTYHRPEKGGYDDWIIELNNEQYTYQADIRIPGLVLAHDPLPVEREKVCVLEFYSKQSLSNFDYINNPIINGLIDLTFNTIEPVRNFRYIAICCLQKYTDNCKLFLNKISKPAKQNILVDVLKVLQPELQIQIDEGIYNCIVYDLIDNIEWRKRYKLT